MASLGDTANSAAMNAPFIPAKTAEKLNGEIPKGMRHKAAMDIAVSLIGNGLSENAVFQTLRDKFPEDVTDSELEGVVAWAGNKNPTPSGYGTAPASSYQAARGRPFERKPAPPEMPKRTPLEHANWWLTEQQLSVEKTIESSPFKIPEAPAESCLLTFELLYKDDDFVNIVCDYTTDDADPNKTRPSGPGKVLTSLDWQAWVKSRKVPQSKAGAWVRLNPCGSFGSGSGGAVTDDDVYEHRFLLVESDVLPLPTQLALYTRLKLPVAAILLSGGKSAHAWVRLDSPDEDSYRESGKRILAALEPFGIDPANKNPSRLSRLPGAFRVIGADNGGLQRLLWINPNPKPLDLKQFESSLSMPAVEDKPFQQTIANAGVRYEELANNRGKLGVMTGLVDFDRDTGGLKGGQMTVIAAETNGGKSTVAINFANAAIQNGSGVLLITLEMDRDEICDLIVSMNCDVNRNCFNTGGFSSEDILKITAASPRLASLPLWIDDSPTLTVNQVRERVMRLNSENKIGLVIVDYVQIISPEDNRDPREQQVAKIARDIRALAKESKLPFIVLSQLNDDGKLRESRVVAHEAHNVILLQADESKYPATMKMKVVKGRRIPKKNYNLIYFPQFCRIASTANVSEEDIPQSQSNQFNQPEL